MQRSEHLAIAIQESRTRLAGIDADLETVGAELAERTAAEDLDTKCLSKLVGERSKLLQERELLALRLSGLEQQKREAERMEAKERIDVITAQASQIAAEAQADVVRFQQAIDLLGGLVNGAGVRQRRYAELRDEARYLATLHGFDNPLVPTPPIPDLEPLRHLLREGQAALLWSGSSLWSIQLDRLQDERSADARRQAQPQTAQMTGGRESGQAILAKQYTEPKPSPLPNHAQRLLRG